MRWLVRMPVLLSGLMLYAGQGWADTLKQTWSAFASEEHVTNPLLNPAGQSQSVWRSTLNPSYLLTDSLGKDVLNAGLDLMLVKSSNTSIYANQTNPGATLGWKHLSDKGSFGISSNYSRTSTLSTEPSATGLVSANSIRTSRTLSADWTRELSERTTLALNGGYTDIAYSGSGNSANLSDYASQSSGMRLNYAWNEHTATFANLSYVNLVPTGSGPSSRQYDARLGMIWSATDRVDWTVQGGPSRLENAGAATTSMQGGMTMNYKGQQSNLSLSANRQSTPSGLGEIIIVDQANGNLSYDLGERSKTGIDLGWRQSKYLGNNIYRTAGVWYHYDLSTSWGIKAYCNHNTNVLGGLNSATSTSNILGLSIAYTKF